MANSASDGPHFMRLDEKMGIDILNKYCISIAIMHEAAMQVSKWGNSLAIRLPASVVEALDLKEGDDIEVRIVSERSFAIDRRPSLEERLEHLRSFRGRLPNDFSFDRGDSNER